MRQPSSFRQDALAALLASLCPAFPLTLCPAVRWERLKICHPLLQVSAFKHSSMGRMIERFLFRYAWLPLLGGPATQAINGVCPNKTHGRYDWNTPGK